MSDHSVDHGHADHAHEHPTWKQYKWVAFWLTLITVVEVWVYYTPFQHSRYFAPALLVMSAVKFTVVVVPAVTPTPLWLPVLKPEAEAVTVYVPTGSFGAR